MAGTKKQRKARKPPSQVYEQETVYRYWALAGGNVQKAMRLAEEANDKSVPLKAHTWAKYAERHGFAARMAAEEKARWDKYHAEREERQQQVLDQIAEGFEELASAFMQTLLTDIAVLRSGDGEAAKGAEKRLSKIFGSIEAVDRFYRMYLRARGLPEKLTHTKIGHGGAMVVTYGDLEGAVPPAKRQRTRKRARKMAGGA
jgi:hypothetical protein